MDDDITLVPGSSVIQPSHTPWYLFIGDFFNILKAFIGTNYQALPFAFKNSGLILGIIGVSLIAVITDYCCNLLIYCKYIVIDNAIEEERNKGIMDETELKELKQKLSKSVGYGDIGRRAFGAGWGNFVYHLIQIAVWITQYLTLAAYFIFIGNTIMELFPMTPALIPLTNTTDVSPKPNMAAGVPLLAFNNIGKRVKRSALQEVNLFHDNNVQSSLDIIFSSMARNASSYSQEDLGDKDTIYVSDLTDIVATMNGSETTAVEQTTILTTTQPSNSSNTTTPYPTPDIYYVTTAWDLRLLCMIPLAFFLCTSMIRYVRQIGFFSVIASVALAMGAIAVFTYMCIGFTPSKYELFNWVTLPLFVGQLISAYEGIGCIVPIESSMEGHPQTFKNMLHANVMIVAIILISFGSIGYMRYGESVAQLIVHQIPQHQMLSILIDVTLIISVLFTYPIQCFPVIEITENYLFAPGSCSNPESDNSNEYREINEPINSESSNAMERSTTSIEESVKSIAVHVPDQVPAWKRNIVRIVLTLSVCGVGIMARNSYAYLAAFSGAIGCSLLAYILPCVIHLKLKARTEHLFYVVLHVIIITLAVLASVFTLIDITIKIIKGDKDV